MILFDLLASGVGVLVAKLARLAQTIKNKSKNPTRITSGFLDRKIDIDSYPADGLLEEPFDKLRPQFLWSEPTILETFVHRAQSRKTFPKLFDEVSKSISQSTVVS